MLSAAGKSAKRRRARDQRRVFSPLAPGDYAKLSAMAPGIAEANGCVLLGAGTSMAFVPLPGTNRLQAVVLDAKGKQISPPSKIGATKIMFEARAARLFVGDHHVFRDGPEAMDGKEKQTVYFTEIVGNANSAAALEQLKALFRPADRSKRAWAHAVAKCPDHAVVQNMKGSKPDAAKITKHAQSMVDKGAVFFPVGVDEDDNMQIKFSNKIVKAKGEYDPAQFGGTGFDGEAVAAYFEGPGAGSGLSLINFLGRDGSKWEGRPGDIKEIHAGFVIVTLYSDYYAAAIKKFTMPHRLETVVALSCDIDSGTGGSAFTMPDLQALAGLPGAPPAPDDDGDDDDGIGGSDTEPEGGPGDDEDAEFARQRKRAKTGGAP